MKPLDKNYLFLQFRNKIYSKNGMEFQSFFENIMGKAFSDFKKIRPYGNMGDGGNDGYRKKSGVYYQVYAPETPKIKEKDASNKLNTDFKRLKSEWDQISKINEYNFVFNDKYGGSVQLLEQTISDLREKNKNITFKLFLAEDLEEIFFQLKESDILNLGFNIDARQAIINAYKYIEKAEIELDRGNAIVALKILENCEDIISEFNDDALSLEYEILECQCIQKLEKITEVKEKYENISKRFPRDPRAFLYLAEIFLNERDSEKNKNFLEKAKNIDENHWLLKLENLIRKNHLGEKIDLQNVDEFSFPDNPRVKSSFYRLYSFFYETSGDKTNADSFIEKAIHINSDRLSNYIVRLSLIEERLFSVEDRTTLFKKSNQFLEENKKVEKKISEFGYFSARNRSILNIKKLNALSIQENFSEIERISQQTLELSLNCYFDKLIDQILTSLLKFASLQNIEFAKLLKYLEEANRVTSDELAKVLIFQFTIREKLFTDGIKFFEKIKAKKFLYFIKNIETQNNEQVLEFLQNDTQFAVIMANTLKQYPKLRKKIIEKLPDDKRIQKEKLLLLLNYDEKNFNDAFEILKKIDLTSLSYFECLPILKIVQEKKAWDFEILVLKKLLEKESNKEEKFNIELQLFTAYLNLKNYRAVIETGERLLKQYSIDNVLNKKNKEALLTNTIIACFERGKFDTSAFKKSYEILDKYKIDNPSFEFKAGLEAEVYLRNNRPKKALESVVEGVKIKKIFLQMIMQNYILYLL